MWCYGVSNNPKYNFPADNAVFIKHVENLLFPIKPFDSSIQDSRSHSDTTIKLEIEYYFIFFLFIELLGYKYEGPFEKVAWVIEFDYEGRKFIILYKKFGLFISGAGNKLDDIVKKLNKAIKETLPYFEYRARGAINTSEINVDNYSDTLYKRFKHFFQEYSDKKEEANKVFEKMKEENHPLSSIPRFHIKPQLVTWIFFSVLESFFSWTDHVFLHLFILKGRIKTGKEAAEFMIKPWREKYMDVFDIKKAREKKLYDNLISVYNIRSSAVHGVVGKH